MTSRERIEAALNHMELDRTPVFEYVLLPSVAEVLLGRRYVEYAGSDMDGWLSMTKELGWEKAVRQYAVNRVDLALLLGHDMLYVVPCPDPDFSSLKENLPVSDPLVEMEDDPVERMIQRDRRYESTSAGLSDDIFLVYNYLKEELSRRDMDLPILAPAYAHEVWMDVDLMQDYDN